MAHAAGNFPQAVACPHSTDHHFARGRRMTSLAKIPVTVITGFLGSGKTTLIRHLMTNANGKKLAVLVNEFGSEGVDGEILKSCADANCPEENIVELANGCICCTVADDFIPTMQTLLARKVRPDHILIETSGLALPKPLLKAFDWPEIRSRITVDGVIALADAEAVAAGRFAPDPSAVEAQRAADESIDHETPLSEVFEDQVSCADIVLLTKADLAGEAGLAAARRAIGEEAHEHDDFASVVVELPEVTDVEALVAAIGRLSREQNVLRAKGFLAVKGKPMRLLVQSVGERVRHQFDKPWGANPRQSKLVVIGEHGDIDEEAIRAGLGL